MKVRLTLVLMLASLSVLVACEAMAQDSASASSPATSSVTAAAPAVELVKVLAWPVVALLIAGVFRREIALFVSALGSRITKLSLFKVELELAPAVAATFTPLLDEIRSATNAATISSSSHAGLAQAQFGPPADYALISLGKGDQWLTSRLYIAAVLMERMRGVKVIVFVKDTRTTERRFVAVVPVRQLRWALAQHYPWLDAAWARSLAACHADPKGPSRVLSDTGGFAAEQVLPLVTKFIDSLQRSPQAASESGWVPLPDKTKEERAAWVTHKLLTSLLPQDAFDAWAKALRDAPRAQRTRAVLRRVAPFIALVETNREFTRLTNRQALLEEIAATLGEEPEDGARGVSRRHSRADQART